MMNRAFWPSLDPRNRLPAQGGKRGKMLRREHQREPQAENGEQRERVKRRERTREQKLEDNR